MKFHPAAPYLLLKMAFGLCKSVSLPKPKCTRKMFSMRHETRPQNIGSTPAPTVFGFNLGVAVRGDFESANEYLTVTIISASGVQTLVTSDCGSGTGSSSSDCGSSYVTCVAETDIFTAQIYEAVLASGGSVTFRFDASDAVDSGGGCSPYAEARVTLTLSDGSLLTQDGYTSTNGGMFDVTFTDITFPTPNPTASPTSTPTPPTPNPTASPTRIRPRNHARRLLERPRKHARRLPTCEKHGNCHEWRPQEVFMNRRGGEGDVYAYRSSVVSPSHR